MKISDIKALNLTPQAKRRFTIFVIVAAGLVLGAVIAYRFNAQTPAPRPAGGPVTVEVAKVSVTMLEDAVTSVGALRAIQSVVLKSEVAGRISAIHFADGSLVKRGQDLISFDAGIQQAQVMQAKAERDLAAAKLKRTQELFDKKFLSAAALDDAKASEQIAQAKLELAQANLEKYLLRAPFDGTIGIRQVSVGDYIKEGVDLVNIEDTSVMRVDFRLPEVAVAKVAVGQSVALTSDVYPGQVFKARVMALDSAIEASGRSLLIRAELNDPSKRLKPGTFVRVSQVINVKQAAMVVPEEAVVSGQNSAIVFRVVEGKAVRTPVQVGLRKTADGKTVVEITKGLTAEDTVVTAGQVKIRGDNVAVKIAGS